MEHSIKRVRQRKWRCNVRTVGLRVDCQKAFSRTGCQPGVVRGALRVCKFVVTPVAKKPLSWRCVRMAAGESQPFSINGVTVESARFRRNEELVASTHQYMTVRLLSKRQEPIRCSQMAVANHAHVRFSSPNSWRCPTRGATVNRWMTT